MDHTPESEAKCAHYARFARGLTVVNFDTLYWILFISVIMLLFYASTTYDKCIKLTAELHPGSKEHRRHMIKCLAICGLCTVVAVVAVVMETFALLALQFCDGADLMMLYWSTWTMLQVGSVIAIFGVMLAVFHVLRERKPPAWGLALGTPVLVVAGLGHFLHDCVYNRLKSLIPKYREQRQETVSISQSSTLRAATPVNEESIKVVARLFGHTLDGGTIIELTGDIRQLPLTDERIGTGVNGQALIACGKDSEMARLVAAGSTASDRRQTSAAPGGSLSTTTTNESQAVTSGYGHPEPAVAGPSTTPAGTSGNDGDRTISFQNMSIRETWASPAKNGAGVIQQDV